MTEEGNMSMGGLKSFQNSSTECYVPREYCDMIKRDFDLWKTFEDNVLLIINEHSRMRIVDPSDSMNYKNLFPKLSDEMEKKRSLFLDIGDSMVYVNLHN
jgi:hypothetical protein